MAFTFERTELEGAVVIRPDVYHDERGFFLESFKRSAYAAAGVDGEFVQDNISHSHFGVLRGLHYQKPPHAQSKLVWVVVGRIFDVAIDIRQGSPTFGRWHGVELSDENMALFYVPEGFAHGFVVLSNVATVMYKVTRDYAPKYDAGIIWNDPDLSIDWPIDTPKMSTKDAQLPRLADIESVFSW